MVDYALAAYLIMLGAAIAILIFIVGYRLGKHGNLDESVDKRKRKDRS